MDFLTGVFFVVGLRRSQGLVGTGGVESGGRKSHALRVHDGRARSVQRSDAMVNGRFDEKGPLIGDVARHVDDGAVSFGFQVLFVL